MNNNNNRSSNNSSNNNRRRGRNNSGRSGGGGNGGGGGNPGNRIDSRARGNAPQMLEKYRKLAHDASLNDDRVLTEYYLQFADHYFRVMADMKTQRDEQQSRQGVRRDFERGPDDDGEYARDGGRDDVRDGGRDDARDYEREDTRSYSGDNSDRARDTDRENERAKNNDRSNDRSNPGDRERAPRRAAPRPQRSGAENVSQGFEGEADHGGNPFSPEPREAREVPREAREVPREPRERKPARRRAEPRDDTPADGLSADMLPPAIARADDAEAQAKPARKPLRVRTKRPVADETGEDAVEVVG